MLRDHQAAFSRLLLGRDAVPAPALLAALALPAGADGGPYDGGPYPGMPRLGVHRATVRSGLTAALAAAFPVVARLVGTDFFDALAYRFIRARPPAVAPLLRYGDLFPAFIACDAAAASLPYLGDVARLERAYVRSYHAAEAPVLTPADLATAAEDALADLRLVPHPSCRFVISPYPVDLIWRDNQDGVESAAVLDLDDPARAGPTRLLVHRPGAAVVMTRLSAGTMAFLLGLSAGQPLALAWDSGLAGDPAFDLATELGRCLAAGLFTAPQSASVFEPRAEQGMRESRE